ncbi:MAG: nucleoside deaminase [Rhodospirillales bacterium]|nr:nucleoside deaminase [Rhodospirillales bacterium]
MELALAEARQAGDRGETPVGAVVVCGGVVLGAAGNRVREANDPTAHAEVLAIRAACEHVSRPRLDGADLHVTLEPCAMCAGTIAAAHIARLYYGAADPKGGAVDHGPHLFSQPTCYHRPEIYGGIDETRCAALLKEFFAALR